MGVGDRALPPSARSQERIGRDRPPVVTSEGGAFGN